MKPDLVAIRRTLARLAEVDHGHRLFGAYDHNYRLNPPVDGAVLERVERALGGRLPEGYRDFITLIGDGGAGPYYGVLPLAEGLERLSSLELLGQDSPLRADVDFGELAGRPADWHAHVARLESDTGYALRYDELRRQYLRPPWINGLLPLVDYGCGDLFVLVLRGPRRGTVWVDSVASGTGLYCLEVDFPTFYQRWLNDALDRVERGDFAPRDARCSWLEFGVNPRYQPIHTDR